MREYRLISKDFEAGYHSDFDNLKRKDLRPMFIAMGASAILTAVIGYYSVKLLLVFL